MMLAQQNSAAFKDRKGGVRLTNGPQVHRLICALTAVATLATPGLTLVAQEGATTAARQDRLEEIIVTATKRETNLQETAAAISVLTSDTLEKRHIVGMEDYLAGIPGVSYSDRGAGSNTITIRGIGLGSQLDPNSPVGSYFGEVPVTGLGPQVNANQAGNADIKMVDIQRVEVLRGPQGTLYGSGTMGGTVRVIPNAPNLQELEGSFGTEYSTTDGGGGNYMGQAVVNAPLVQDKFAMRLLAYRYDNDGYIDNMGASNPDAALTTAINAGAFVEDRENVGGETFTGMRLSALWQLTDKFSATVMHLYQQIEQDGFKEVETNLPGNFQQVRAKVGRVGLDDEYVNMDLEITNLVLDYDLGWGGIANSTSFVNSEAASDVELSMIGAPFVGASSLRMNEKDVFVNELRLTSNFDGPIQFLTGLYYEDRTVDIWGSIGWNGLPPVPVGTYTSREDARSTQKQIAGFGELSWNPIDPLTLTFGARYFEFEQAVPLSRTNDVPSAAEGQSASVDDTTLKFNVSYELSEQFFGFAQWSQGFREPRFQTPLRPEYDADNDGLVEFRDGIERRVTEGLLAPDTVDNYEAGIKFQSREGWLQGSLTAFLIDWEGIPIVPSITTFLGAAIYFNAGEARSEGVELELSGEVMDDMFFELSGSWVDSRLTEAQVGLGDKGADLPGSADYNVKAALEKRFFVGDRDSFVRADYTYVGEYFSQFQEIGIPAGDYQIVDLSGGVAFGNINVGLFVKNATNSDDFTWVDNLLTADRAYRLRPRTIGVSVSAAF